MIFCILDLIIVHCIIMKGELFHNLFLLCLISFSLLWCQRTENLTPFASHSPAMAFDSVETLIWSETSPNDPAQMQEAFSLVLLGLFSFENDSHKLVEFYMTLEPAFCSNTQ